MMKTFSAAIAALVVGIVLALPGTAAAQAPAASLPTNQPEVALDVVSERPQYASVPGVETNRLIQGAGREWRQLRNGPVTQAGGWLLVLAFAGILAFHFVKGTIKLRKAPTGRTVERFSAVERITHWTVAITFIALALTGMVLFFGKHLILPWLGYGAFSTLTVAGKNVHNFVGPLFAFAVVVMILVYAKDNWPSGNRFNGLEKLWFWGGLGLLGIAVSATGLILDFPNWNQGRELMQQANAIHAIAAIVFIAGAMGHIYMGTAGTEGAYRGMREGFVDEAWAEQHHALWLADVQARAPYARAAQRTGTPGSTRPHPAAAPVPAHPPAAS